MPRLPASRSSSSTLPQCSPAFLASLYVIYIICRALINPQLAPKLSADQYRVPVPDWLARLERGESKRVFGALLLAVLRPGVLAGATTPAGRPVSFGFIFRNFAAASVPLVLVLSLFCLTWWFVLVRNAPDAMLPPEVSVEQTETLQAPAEDEEVKELGAGEQEMEEQQTTRSGPLGDVAPRTVEEGAPEGFTSASGLPPPSWPRSCSSTTGEWTASSLRFSKMLTSSVVPLAVLTLSVLGAICSASPRPPSSPVSARSAPCILRHFKNISG